MGDIHVHVYPEVTETKQIFDPPGWTELIELLDTEFKKRAPEMHTAYDDYISLMRGIVVAMCEGFDAEVAEEDGGIN